MKALRYETNMNKGLYFKETQIKIEKAPKRMENKIINIYPDITYQKLMGFGAAITESAGYSYNMLSEGKKTSIIEECFTEDGLNYNIVRLPIGSTDFSLKSFSYSSRADLSDFNIERDEEYILPLLKKIEKELIILASPWSPPGFMKNTRLLCYGGKLRSKYRQTWANYLLKYIKEYEKKGFIINYLTIQNEPTAIQRWESCIYDSDEEADFAINYLYPTLNNNNVATKILIWDHNKDGILKRANEEFSKRGAVEAIDGVAYHYYTGDHFENLKLVRETYPNKLLIHSEGCTGYSNFREEDEIQNGEIYAHDIIGDLNNGANAYIDWNLMLDNKGGPNHKKNYCNSPIMLNEDATDYIKNLTYYYIGHFSKFIMQGATRIAFSRYTTDLEVTAFLNPDETVTIVILNKNNYNIEYNLYMEENIIKDEIEAHSIVTIII